MHDLATGLITDLAQILGLAPNLLNSLHAAIPTQHSGTPAASSLETIHHMAPSTTSAAVNTNESGSCEAHVDKGLLTLIFPDMVQGLQVQACKVQLCASPLTPTTDNRPVPCLIKSACC